MTTPETLGLRAFARHLKKKASYISQLKGDGRLVLSDCGKQIKVAESIQRIQDTMDPSKFAVSARHAANREAMQANVAPQAQIATQSDLGGRGEELAAPASGTAGAAYQNARAVRERYLALSAKRDHELAIGKLLPAVEVLSVISAAITSLRSRLEGLPDVLASQLAACTDELQARNILFESIEHALEDMSRQFNNIAKETE